MTDGDEPRGTRLRFGTDAGLLWLSGVEPMPIGAVGEESDRVGADGLLDDASFLELLFEN